MNCNTQTRSGRNSFVILERQACNRVTLETRHTEKKKTHQRRKAVQVVFRHRTIGTATEQPTVVPSESLDAGVGHQFSVDVRFVRNVPYFD